MSVQTEVDRIIDWYERNRPSVKTLLLNVRPQTVYKFAGKPTPGQPVSYRGFRIDFGRISAEGKRIDESLA